MELKELTFFATVEKLFKLFELNFSAINSIHGIVKH